MSSSKKLKMGKNGKRVDGRDLDEMRPIKVEVDVVDRADGSALVQFGKTIAIASVYGPREVKPRHMEHPEKAVVRVNYNMMPFSTTERVRPGRSRRSIEISKVSSDALEAAIQTDKYPNSAIDIFIEIMQADAGTRVTGINAAAVALADAGIAMRDMVAAVAVGKVDGNIVLDLCQEEDNFGEADMPIAIMPNKDEVTLLQMDGDMTQEEMKKAIKMAKKACKEIYKIQKDALKKEYKVEEVKK